MNPIIQNPAVPPATFDAARNFLAIHAKTLCEELKKAKEHGTTGLEKEAASLLAELEGLCFNINARFKANDATPLDTNAKEWQESLESLNTLIFRFSMIRHAFLQESVSNGAFLPHQETAAASYPVSLEFEFTNPILYECRTQTIKDVETLSKASIATFNETLTTLRNAMLEKCKKEEDRELIVSDFTAGKPYGHKKKECEIKKFEIKFESYTIEYDWDEAVIECRLVRADLGLFFKTDGKQKTPSPQQRLLEDLKNYVFGLTQISLGSNLGALKLVSPEKSAPLQCHINLDRGMFANQLHLLWVYDTIMKSQGNESEEGILLNSGVLAERIISYKLEEATEKSPKKLLQQLNKNNPAGTGAGLWKHYLTYLLKASLHGMLDFDQVINCLILFGNYLRPPLGGLTPDKQKSHLRVADNAQYLAINVVPLLETNVSQRRLEYRRCRMPLNETEVIEMVQETVRTMKIAQTSIKDLSDQFNKFIYQDER